MKLSSVHKIEYNTFFKLQNADRPQNIDECQKHSIKWKKSHIIHWFHLYEIQEHVEFNLEWYNKSHLKGSIVWERAQGKLPVCCECLISWSGGGYMSAHICHNSSEDLSIFWYVNYASKITECIKYQLQKQESG